jgi:hypothetical protein
MQNTFTGHEDNLFSNRNLRNMKNGFQHKIPFSVNFKALKKVNLNITPSMNYSGVLYTTQIRKTYIPDTVSLTKDILVVDTIRRLSYAHALAPSLSISLAPKFVLMNKYGPNSKVEAIRTIITPTAGVNYTPDLKRFFNYSETIYDRNGKKDTYSIYERQGAYSVPTMPGQSGSVSLGVNGNVEMKVRSTDSTSNEQSKKVKLINNMSATTSYNIFADSLNWSDISLSANTTIFGLNLSMNGRVDPYKLNTAGTNKINQFGPRLTSLSFNTGISLPLNKKDGKKAEDKKDTSDPDPYSYFDVPWSVNLTYSLTYNKEKLVGNVSQTLGFSGNINFTKKWTFNFNSSYDFKEKKIAQAQMSINRDLHCWQMSMSFSPFGLNKHYFFKINVKSSTLQDLKYEKKKNPGDFSRSAW